MNIANMPMQLVRELRERGHVAEQVQYTLGAGHKFGYKLDNEVNIKDHGGRVNAHAHTLKSYLERDFDIFHFWNKSLFFENYYKSNTGLDLPLIKARGKRIAYRFTGFDARLPSRDMPINKFSPFHSGYKHLYDEDVQKNYLGFLEEYVDQFIVQDPEMGQFAKNAKVVPRALDLTKWDTYYPEPTDVPLIVHAPSKPVVKGTKFIEEAISALKKEGLKFEYKRIENFSHEEAISYYKKADIIVDQILIGATGVLTLEGWALGKPVVVFLREDLFNDFYDTNDLPIGNATPETIKPVLKRLIEDYDLRLDLGKRARKLVEKYHHLPIVTDGLVKIYEDMMSTPLHYPTGTRDVDYLKAQTLMIQTGMKAKNPNQFILARKNQIGIIRAAKHIKNISKIQEKITAVDEALSSKKTALHDEVESGVPAKVAVHLKRYRAVQDRRDIHYNNLQQQINKVAEHLNNNEVTVNKAQFQSLNANERMVLLSNLLPGWAITLLKPLIVLRRIFKYGKFKSG